MDWVEWFADAWRDVVLLVLGAVIAWLSGLSAAKRAEKSEDKKRLAADAASLKAREIAEADARTDSTAREARDALKVIYELDRSLEGRGSFDAGLAPDLLARLRAIGDLIPDRVVRQCVSDVCDLANNFELLESWKSSDRPAVKAATEMTFHSRILTNGRAVLAAASRKESAPPEESEELAELAETLEGAIDAYWANQATAHEQIQAENGKSSASRTVGAPPANGATTETST